MRNSHVSFPKLLSYRAFPWHGFHTVIDPQLGVKFPNTGTRDHPIRKTQAKMPGRGVACDDHAVKHLYDFIRSSHENSAL